MSTAYALPLPAAGAVQVPPHERVVLPNGATLIIMPRRDVPLISFQAVLQGWPLGRSHIELPVAGVKVCQLKWEKAEAGWEEPSDAYKLAIELATLARTDTALGFNMAVEPGDAVEAGMSNLEATRFTANGS